MTTAPRRFYKSASAIEADSGFAVALDERRLKTPGGRAFAAPTRALAQAMASEWDAQAEHITPASMPLTQLAFAAVDWTGVSRDQRIEYVQSFAVTDLCCHRADAPAELVARQAAHWDPLVAWGAVELGAKLAVVTGVIAAEPSAEALGAVQEAAAALDDFRLTAVTQASGLSGSALIAFALLRGRIDSTQAFEAAALDDLWSLEKWGEDAEARARVERVRDEFMALGRYIEALADGA
ncbi:MAG: ATPase [Caulobacterales bacterium]|jgi:chaperone required for assembly of F1-ATPase|nr:ATPase [Caulobacterales bacterium]